MLQKSQNPESACVSVFMCKVSVYGGLGLAGYVRGRVVIVFHHVLYRFLFFLCIYLI